MMRPSSENFRSSFSPSAFVKSSILPNEQMMRFDSTEAHDSHSRLARNRKTARLRRQRKKEEATRLTRVRTEALLRKSNLKGQLEKINEVDKLRFQSEFEKIRVSGCLFCDHVFALRKDSKCSEKGYIEICDHYQNEHLHLVKSNVNYLGEDFVQIAAFPEKLLQHIKALSEKSSVLSEESNVSSDSCSEIGGGGNCSSPEERKKRRLQRNAESARLCRQRKKLYIQKLRLELPQILYENETISKFLAELQTSKHEIQGSNQRPIVEIPKMEGWDCGYRRDKERVKRLKVGDDSENLLDVGLRMKEFVNVNVDQMMNLSMNTDKREEFMKLMLSTAVAWQQQQQNKGNVLNFGWEEKDGKDVYEAACVLSSLAQK